jgi:hypothetical protein
VPLARFNPIGLAESRSGEPVYADARDPRQAPAVRALLDAVAADTGPGPVRVTGEVPWRRRPATYREHALFVTASADQAREQLACGARVIFIGAGPGAGTAPDAGSATGAGMATGAGAVTGAVAIAADLPALREKIAALRDRPPLSSAETLPVLREIFTAQATPARLAALARMADLGDHVIAGRRIAVLSRAAGAGAASALAAGLTGQRFLPSELVVLAEAPDAASAELSARRVAGALAGLADRDVTVRAVPVVTGGPDTSGPPGPGSQPEPDDHRGPAGWLRRAAAVAHSPWVAPWQAGREYPGTYLLDLACARECAQADAAGYGGASYAFTAALDPALARREYFTAADPSHALRFFSVS